MRLFIFGKPRFITLLGFVQVLMLVLYLMINVANVGESGSAISLLAMFFILSLGILILQSINNNIIIPYLFFPFALFIVWLTWKVVIDLNDVYYLRQVTIGTTGGILLFYLVGVFARKALNSLMMQNRGVFLIKILLVFFLLIAIWVFVNFQSRLLDNVDKYYIEGVDDGYQRPGNFLIIFFMILSFSYVTLALQLKNKIQFLFWVIIYTSIFIISLASSQLFGSNAATANVIAIYLITIVISVFSFNRKVRNLYLNNNLTLPISKKSIKSILQYALLSLITVIFLGKLILDFTGFDLNRTRLLGFGSGETSSVTSRFDILFNTGLEQLSYAPFFGDMNVAKLTTGYSDLILHNFLLNIMAELGLIGLLITLVIFYYVFKKLVRQSKVKTGTDKGYDYAIVNSWLFFIVLYFFIYANFTVSKSWIVIWFAVGFISITLNHKKIL